MGCDRCLGCSGCASLERETHRSDSDKKDITRRLNIIEGQIRGINQMIENDRYCADVLIQVAAAEKALKSLGQNILENHLKTCVSYDIQMGNFDSLDEAISLIKKLQ